MPRISRIRKEIRTSHWFTKSAQLGESPLTSLTRTGGLKNLNNVCYINSCLQCLLHCEPFVRVMLHNKHDSNERKHFDGFCALCATMRISRDMLQNKTEIGSANELSSQCHNLNTKFELGVQQDADEFLDSLLTKMMTEEKRGCGAIDDSAQDGMAEPKKSLIDQLFRFRRKQILTCAKCGTKSETEDVCNRLILRSTKESEEKINTVDEALGYSFGYEVLDGENAYHCENCNELVKGTKSLSLMEGPNVLVICLARFSVAFNEENKPVFKKASHVVKFPERLDVTPYMDDMTAEEELQFGVHQYRLSSFLSHIGEGIHDGHYVANVFLPSRSSKSRVGSWWKKNDTGVSQVGFEKDASAYLMFYTREDLLPRGLVGPRKKNKSKKKKGKTNETGSDKVRRESDPRPKVKGSSDVLPKREVQRVFLFPRLDMVRRPKWYYSDEEGKNMDDIVFLTRKEFDERGLTIESDDEIELLYDEDST